MTEINDSWECFKCGNEFKFQEVPSGYISNYHPLCKVCVDKVCKSNNSFNISRLTFHYQYGDIKVIRGTIFYNYFQSKN